MSKDDFAVSINASKTIQKVIEIDASLIKYIKLVAALPGAEFSINPIKSSMKSWHDFVPCPFRFDGGIGALSSMHSAGDLDLGNIEQWRTE